MGNRRGRGEMAIIWVASFACIWAWIPSCVNGTTDQNDVSALNVFFTSMNLPSQLQGWTANGGDPCGQSWQGISCSGSSVTAIKLTGLGLSGNLGNSMNTMRSLTELDLSANNLGGVSTLQYSLPPNLEKLNIANNQFGGNLPYSISSMATLKYLNVAHNQLQGDLIDFFRSLTNLATLDLSFNSLTGDLPQSFISLTSLNTLYLQNNQFSGHLDVLTYLPLQTLNVANNRFTGWIPDQLKKIESLQTDGNSWNSGPAPPPPPYRSPPSPHRLPSPPYKPQSGGGRSGISGGGIAGIVISFLVVGGAIAFFLIRRKSKRPSREENLEQGQPFAQLSLNEAKVAETKGFEINTDIVPPPAPLYLKPLPNDRHISSYDEDDVSNRPISKKANNAPIKATVYSIADLQIATDCFSIDNFVGEGFFGGVFRAQFGDGKILAVKKINPSVLPNHSSDDFLELVSNISHLHHPNLSELVGYCSEHGQYLLVYEFHKNGSLHDFLHLFDEYMKPLSWSTRIKISLGAARALEYLHEVCSPSLVYKNFKSSNILLDEDLNPHLSDYGFEGLVPIAKFQASEQVIAPEVAMSGQYTLKSDVYGFGVVMLELLTGRKPFDSSRPWSEQSLVRWATPQLHDIDALDRMVDPALKGLYPAKSLSRIADVIALCVQPEPEFRPPMSEVVQALVRLVKRASARDSL